ncbi:MAG: bifunctional DNA primase/polymerase [Nocardioidaceae bacterium]
MAEAALAYATRGWAVFPCHSPAGPPGTCSCCRSDCASPGKHPRVAGGLTAATTDRSTIERWWRHWPSANLAIRTGAVSGIVVLDIDPGHGGDETLSSLLDEHGSLPPGAVVRTGSGGRHIYFAHPGGLIRNDAGRRFGPGLDIRGDGGYVVAPPSRHTTGPRYRWDSSDRTLAALPDWLHARLGEAHLPRVPRSSTPTTISSPERVSSWARSALERELASVASAREGTRNATLNKAAFSLGQIVAGGGLDADEVECLLLDRAGRAGLGEREARATIGSGLSAGARRPRSPAPETVDLRTVPLPGTPSSVRTAPTPKAPIADIPSPR